ncbi:hypothetical protein [Butyrivibrio sp. AE2032]|uniref:hypothetical protein n=1 Tax=Butyrivibrio sp. AE2032 TaxID=1458463 RepID=UPI0005579CE3|nr:hypothetical protein [Butyrivibrio sp. AE2032]
MKEHNDFSKNLKYWKKNYFQGECSELEEILRNNKSRINDTNELCYYAKEVGYEILGPILVGFLKWLNYRLKSFDYKKIFFFSREGRFIQKAYNTAYGIDDHATYMYVSRRAISNALLSFSMSYSEIITIISVFLRTPTFETLCNVCCLDKKQFEKELAECNLRLSDNVYIDEKEKQNRLYGIIMRLGGHYFYEQNVLLSSYLEQISFDSSVAVCDVGWQGTIQYYLQSFLSLCKKNTDIHGFYLGLRVVNQKEKYPGIKKEGYLFDLHNNRNLDYMFRFTNELFEMMFMGGEGSLLSYTKSTNGEVLPVFSPLEYRECDIEFIENIQTGALMFVSAYYNDSAMSGKLLSPDVVTKGYVEYAVKPTMATVNRYRDFGVYEEKILPMVPKNGFSFYLFHPHAFFHDLTFYNKIFFLKKIFRVRLPYYHILRIVVDVIDYRSDYRKKVD